MNMILAIAAGGAVGALARHFFAHWINSQMAGHFPWGIMLCNILGAFLMGALIEMSAMHWSLSQEFRAFLVVGILGSFTTFSTFALDTVLLMQRGQSFMMILYVGVSVAGAIIALMLAMMFVRQFT
ncbi:fluoride efflux transporter CrcB [Curvivirga aplysinae]|uniref:fluoride efflux transporter CrcB n=1 Tax=Curvivirga aplysinae TaxID=2529852 RepID=UPI0012BC0322|nr:fluoride efflux transporter CrcB [Curvivirga aplysinae]MTI11271.1 fluoride efflux transporter CrcB [Curvivirga aplysinae]